VRWLFVTGIALDISGAVMVLLAIVRASASDVAQEAVTYAGRYAVGSYQTPRVFLPVDAAMLDAVAEAGSFPCKRMGGRP
jgi:hypothetical protein